MASYRDPIDIYLLRVLHTLLVEGSVTRAAVKLNQSQPAISAALKRLRDITGDPLLVRGKSGMVPTERGAALLEPTVNALHAISRIAMQQSQFDPANTMRRFRIGSPDYLNILFVPRLVETFRKVAPNAALELHPLTSDAHYETALEEGQFDLMIGNWPEAPRRLHRRDLFRSAVQQTALPEPEGKQRDIEGVRAGRRPPERQIDEPLGVNGTVHELRQQVIGGPHGQHHDAADEVHVGVRQRVDHVPRAAVRTPDGIEPVPDRRHHLQHAVDGADGEGGCGKKEKLG